MPSVKVLNTASVRATFRTIRNFDGMTEAPPYSLVLAEHIMANV